MRSARTVRGVMPSRRSPSQAAALHRRAPGNGSIELTHYPAPDGARASFGAMRTAAGSSLLGAAGVLLFVALFFGGASGDERLFWIGMGAFLVALVAWAAAFWGGLSRPAPTPAAAIFISN